MTTETLCMEQVPRCLNMCHKIYMQNFSVAWKVPHCVTANSASPPHGNARQILNAQKTKWQMGAMQFKS